MKSRRLSAARLSFPLATSIAALLAVQSASAIVYYWDNNGATTGFGTAAGTWSSTGTLGSATQGWGTVAAGTTAPTGTITTSTSDSLNFGTATNGLVAGTITVSGTVNAASITVGTASGTIAFSGGTINLASGGTINDGANTVTMGSALSGTGNIGFTGGGTVNFTASGTAGLGATFTATVSGGSTLKFSSGGHAALGGSTGYTINLGGATSAGTIAFGNSGTLANKITVVAGTGGRTITNTTSVSPGVSGAITANENLTISNTNTGTLTVSGTGSSVATSKVIAWNASGSGTLTDSNTWSGAGSMTYTGGAGSTLTVSGAKTYGGGATLNTMTTTGEVVVSTSSAGPANAPTSGAFGTGTLSLGATRMRAATGGTDITIGNAITFTGAPVFHTIASEKSLIFSGNASLGASRIITVDTGATVAGKGVEFSGIISGGGFKITTAGTGGLLILSGANSYTGGTDIGGTTTLQLGNGTATGSLSTTGAITVGTGATFAVKQSDTVTQGTDFNGAAITGAGSFSQTGTGTTILNAANSFSGGTTISAGTLVAGLSGNGTNSTLGSVSNTRTITVNTGGTLRADVGNIFSTSFATAASSLPTLAIAGGTMTNGGAATNSALGNITLTGGTLTATTGSPAGTASGQGFGSWNLNGTVTSTGTSTISSTAGAGIPITLNATNGLISPATIFDVTSGTLTASAALGQVTRAGNETVGSLAKSGAGTMILSGNNTFTGGVTVNAGTLTLANAGALNSTAGSENAVAFGASSTGTLALGGNSVVIRSLSSNATPGTPVVENANAGNATLTIGNSLNLASSFAGVIQNGTGGGTLGLTKAGTNTLTLSGDNSYTGATLISDGTLTLSGTGDINSTSDITVNGSGTKFLQTSSVAVSPAVTLTQGTLTGSGTVNTVNVGAGTGGIISNNNGVAGAALTIGNLTLAGAANLNLFSNSFSSNLDVTTLTTAATPATLTANNIGGWTNGTAYTLLTFGGGSIAGSGDNFTKVINNLATRQNGTWNTTSSAITLTLAGDNPVWSGANGGTWTTEATNSATSGTPNWALKNALTATDFWVGDIAEFNDTYDIGGGPVAPTTTTVDISTGNVSPASTTFNNSTLGYTLNSTGGFGIASGSLTKNGSGNLTISTANTYTGATNINDGTITLSGSGTLGTGSSLTLGGGKLDLGALSRTVGAVSVTAPAASGDTILNGSLTGTSYAASNTTGNAIISANLLVNGGAGFTKTGAGTVTLSGTNTYTGATAVSAGSLVLSNANTISGATSVAGTATLQLGHATSMGTSTMTLASGATLQLRNDANTTFTAPIATPAAGVTYNFDVNQATGAGTGRTLTLGNMTFATSTANQINVTGGNGYTLGLGTLSAPSGSGATWGFTVNATTAAVTIAKFSAGSFGSGLVLQGGNNINLSNFEMGSNSTNSITVSGIGTVATLGTTTQTNSRAGGNVSYTLNSGTLNLTTTSSLANIRAASGTINAPTFTINGGILNNTSGAALALATSPGTGTVAGSPNMTINGDFAFTGTNDLNLGAGTVSLGTAAGTSRTITANASNLTLGGIISNGTTANKLIKDGAGILTLSGANAYTGGTDVTTGTLVFLNTGAKAASGTHAFAANTTLGLGVATTGSFFTSTDVDNAFAGNMVGNLSNVTVDATTNVGIDTTSATFTYATSVAGSPTRGLVKLGANTLNLTGTNTYTGGTNIDAGTLSFANGALGTTGNITFTRSSTLQWNGTNTEDISARLVMSNGVTSTFDTVANNVTLATGFGSSSTGALTKAGTGILTLSGTNTYSGTTTISAGALRLENSGALGSSALVAITTGTLQLATDTAFSGPNISITGGTINSDRATAGAGLTHVLGNAAISNATHNFTAGTNVTSGTAAIQLGNITNASGSGGNATLNPTTANLIITGGYEGVTNTGTNGVIFGGTSSGNSIAGDIKNGTRTTQNVFKQGNSIWTLSGTNTYTGTTRVDAGALITTKAAALPGLNNLVTFNGGTLGARIGAGGWTTGEVDTLLLSTNAIKTAGALGIDTTTASLVQWTDFTTGVDSLGSALGLTKLGTNTLTLNSVGNNYAGTTTIDQGTLALTVDHTLAGALNFGFGGTNTNTGTLDLSAANATFGSLNVLTNSASNNTITIGSGKTLTIGGNVTVGANVANAVASLVTSGGGNLVVGTGGTNTFIVGGASGSILAGSTAVDLSGLASFTVNYGLSGTFRLGDSTSGSNNPAPSTLKLATDNTITVGNFRIGDSSGGQSIHVLTLGNGANLINATTTNIGSAGGGIRSGGSMIFDPADTTGTLTLNGFGATGTRTILNMVNSTGNTAATMTSIVNLAGHTADVNVSTLTMARRTAGAGGGGTSTLTFDQGLLDVTTLNMAERSSTAGGVTATVNLGDSVAAGVPTVTIGGITMAVSTSAGTATANLNITGGNVDIGTGSGTAINMANAGTGATAASSLSITGGTVTVTGNIIRTVGAGTETATLALNGAGAILDMSGKNITSLTGITYTDGTLKNLGTVNTGMTLAGSGSRVFDQDTGVSGTIQGSITGTGVGLTKQGDGTLTLSGTNSYDGATTVTGGVLSISSDANLGTAPVSPTAGTIVLNGGTLRNTVAITIDENRGMTLGASGGTINNSVNGTTIYEGVIAGIGSLTVSHAPSATGDLSVGGDNTYSGATIIDNGHLSVTNLAVGASSSIGSSSNAAANLVLKNDSILHFQGGASPATTDRLFTLGTGDNEIRSSGAGGINFSNTGSIATVDSGTRTLSLNASNASATNTLSSVIVDGAGGATSLQKHGPGTWSLSGANSYTGTTTVSAGVLAVNGSLANTSTTVAGTLQGSGTIGGSVTIQSGGTLAPGNSIESLGVASVEFLAGSTYAYELDSDALNGDLAYSTGTLDIASGIGPAGTTLTLTELFSGVLAEGSKLTLISYTGGWTSTELFNYLGNTLEDDSTFTLGSNQWLFNYNDTTGGNNFTGDQAGAGSFVTMTVIPEPNVAALLGGLGTLALLRRRRH